MEKAVFASREWAEELFRLAKEDPDMKEATGDFEGPLVLHIKPKEDRMPRGASFWVDGGGGEIRSIEKLAFPGEKDARYTLSASYDVWKSVVSGKLNILKAIVLGKISVKGNKASLLKHVKIARRIGVLFTEIPTEYEY